ncbi:MAG: hypothetical protein M1817_001375 [Caeruleum heppii]|nr:MAG: hypothetical protein M1817_001375 [Caeruleum heppii]
MAHPDTRIWPLRIDSTTHDLHKSCVVKLSFQDIKLVVTLAHQPPSGFSVDNAIEIDFLRRLDSAEECQEFERTYEIQLQLGDYVKSLCEPIMVELRPSIHHRRTQCTLDKILNPETLFLQLVTDNGNARLIKRHDDQSAFHKLDLADKTRFDVAVPTFSPAQIEVLDKMVSNRIMKVRVNEETLCCKLAAPGFNGISREIQVLNEIARVQLHSSSRVPRLKGLVGSTKGVLGFLMDYIDISPQDPHLGVFEKRAVAVTRSRRERWAEQIKNTLHDLHQKGVVWGDGKPSNILLDREDDIWIVDFGGSRTEGWVDATCQESIQGDEQAIRRICSFLDV